MGAILTDRRRRWGLVLLATLAVGTMTTGTVPALAQDTATGTLFESRQERGMKKKAGVVARL